MTDLNHLDSFEGIDSDAALDLLGDLIDAAVDAGSEPDLRRSIRLGEELFAREMEASSWAVLHYFLGNAYSALVFDEDCSAWESEEAEGAIKYFRLASRSRAFADLDPVRRCQVLTNLGNTLNVYGRHVAAIETLDAALAIMPEFGMARSKRATAGIQYAAALHDRGQAEVLYRFGYVDLEEAFESHYIHEGFEVSVDRQIEDLERWYERCPDPGIRHQVPNLYDHSLGQSSAERAYRTWCLANRLFLNPLNDLGAYPIAARDTLTSPSMSATLGQSIHGYVGCFNQIKQEYVSARYTLYASLHTEGVHFSDKDVVLYNTWDYPAYGLSVEMTKTAFRSAYSLFDKIAYFLNQYFDLDIPDHQVDFRTLWYDGRNRKRGLREQFVGSTNRPLRGLFWLGKDLYEQRDGFNVALDPDARQLFQIRNRMEHRYLKVSSEGAFDLDDGSAVASVLAPTGGAVGMESDDFADDLALQIGRRDLESKTLRLMRLAREALTYLSLAVNVEERARRTGRDPAKVVEIQLDAFDDEWKQRW